MVEVTENRGSKKNYGLPRTESSCERITLREALNFDYNNERVNGDGTILLVSYRA